MKEIRYFYVPDAATAAELPAEEAAHAVRVLRMKPGDGMVLMDGKGTFFSAEVTVASPHHCLYRVVQEMPQQPQWPGRFHLGMAPTKLMDRTEWMLEKITEIGIDEVSFLDCANSERRVIKLARLDKILVAAVKQSRKAWKPVMSDMTAFGRFVSEPRPGMKFIAHCYPEIPRANLFDALRGRDASSEVTVLVGPEGDFTPDEVRMAVDAGYVSVSLGDSRLRTETAAMVAVMMMHLSVGA